MMPPLVLIDDVAVVVVVVAVAVAVAVAVGVAAAAVAVVVAASAVDEDDAVRVTSSCVGPGTGLILFVLVVAVRLPSSVSKSAPSSSAPGERGRNSKAPGDKPKGFGIEESPREGKPAGLPPPVDAPPPRPGGSLLLSPLSPLCGVLLGVPAVVVVTTTSPSAPALAEVMEVVVLLVARTAGASWGGAVVLVFSAGGLSWAKVSVVVDVDILSSAGCGSGGECVGVENEHVFYSVPYGLGRSPCAESRPCVN